MKWFKFETEDKRYKEHEPEGMLVYLGPEALKHAIVVNDFEVFQSSPCLLYTSPSPRDS